MVAARGLADAVFPCASSCWCSGGVKGDAARAAPYDGWIGGATGMSRRRANEALDIGAANSAGSHDRCDLRHRAECRSSKALRARDHGSDQSLPVGRSSRSISLPGSNADTGAIMGAAVKAALTVTFGFAKYGHVSYPGAEFCGALEIADIGFAVGRAHADRPARPLIERCRGRPAVAHPRSPIRTRARMAIR